MLELIKNFPEQLLHALELSAASTIEKTFSPKNVIISGLGGSGIGGAGVKELCLEQIKIPVEINNSYDLPVFADEESLIILSSYSGNTEETVTVAKKAIAKGLHTVFITSGGELQKLAEEHQLPLLLIPSGFPPRSCYGYSVIMQMHVLNVFGIIPQDYIQLVRGASAVLSREQAAIVPMAEEIAKKLKGKVFTIFADNGFYSVAIRAKQQFNENSKSLCWPNFFPEMNHNELVAWRGDRSNVPAIFVRSSFDNERNKLRFDFSKEVLIAAGCDLSEIHATGSNKFEHYFYLTHFLDWVSYHLAVLQGHDPMEIDVLIRLKKHLGSIA
jgi:glucose/mannose-6-phosphate isomerase